MTNPVLCSFPLRNRWKRKKKGACVGAAALTPHVDSPAHCRGVPGRKLVQFKHIGTWRSPVAHLNGVQGVAGSNPAVPTG